VPVVPVCLLVRRIAKKLVKVQTTVYLAAKAMSDFDRSNVPRPMFAPASQAAQVSNRCVSVLHFVSRLNLTVTAPYYDGAVDGYVVRMMTLI
jgi:hypothetical protein